jgi:hypothetical protein
VEDISNAVKYQIKRIQEHIESIVEYLVRALLDPCLQTPMMPDSHVPGESNYFYVMITIWYVAMSFPDWKFTLREKIKDCTKQDARLFYSNRLPRENWAFGAADKDKVPLLRWYHHGSVWKLCECGILPETWNDAGLQSKVLRLAKAAKIASAAKLSSRQPYTAEDEIIDRLSFLSDELQLEVPKYETEKRELHKNEVPENGIVVLLCMERLKQRDYTRSLNPGWLSNPEEGSTSGPWEIYALCHHSRLVGLNLDESDSQDWRTKEHRKGEVESYKRKICRFLNGEGTLVPCWERAHAKTRKGWLRSETTAVVGTTILAMYIAKNSR